MTAHPYTLGAVASPPDERDRRVTAFMPATAADIPRRRSFDGFLQPVRDQGPDGACVGFALASGLMGYMAQTQPEGTPRRGRILSPRDAYEGARSIEAPQGPGAFPRAALQWARKRGLCLESDWPYDPTTLGAPSADAEGHREDNRLAGYAAVACNPHALKEAMYWHGPVLVVVEVHEGFWTPDARGVVHDTGDVEGLHAVTLVGWDDDVAAGRELGAFRLRNSWGAGWGQGGYCWLPYSYLPTEAWSATPDLVDDRPPPPPVRPWWERLAAGEWPW